MFLSYPLTNYYLENLKFQVFLHLGFVVKYNAIIAFILVNHGYNSNIRY